MQPNDDEIQSNAWYDAQLNELLDEKCNSCGSYLTSRMEYVPDGFKTYKECEGCGATYI